MSQHLCFNPYNRTLDNGDSNVVLSFKLPVSITILEICTQIYIESDYKYYNVIDSLMDCALTMVICYGF